MHNGDNGQISHLVPVATLGEEVTAVQPIPAPRNRNDVSTDEKLYGAALLLGICSFIGMVVEIANLNFGTPLITSALLCVSCGGVGVYGVVQNRGAVAEEIEVAQVVGGDIQNQQNPDIEAGQVVNAAVITDTDIGTPNTTISPILATQCQSPSSSKSPLKEPLMSRG